jgi:hypothetical protein
MTGEKAGYAQTVDELLIWYRGQRDEGLRVRTTDYLTSADIIENTKVNALAMFPAVTIDVETAKANHSFVHHDNPIDSFSHSPFMRLHIAHQQLRHQTLLELLDRGVITDKVPDELAVKLDPAWQEVNRLPTHYVPSLSAETIHNMAKTDTHLNRFDWEKFNLGFTTAIMLLKRTVAGRLAYGESAGLGYAEATLKLSEDILHGLDTIASCTPWRLEIDAAGYSADVRKTALSFQRNPRIEHYMRPGGMLSDEMLERNDLYNLWLEALTTGERPVGR